MPSFAAFLVLSALALPLASAGSHFSHPRHLAAVERSAVRYRAHRAPRRLKRDGAGEATVRCLTEKTWQLCDGDNCTDMGSVAAGTICKGGAITWDTSSEASPEDSSAASASVEEPDSSSSQAASSSPAASKQALASTKAEETLTAPQKLANNVVAASSSSSRTSSATPSASATAAPAQLNAGASTDEDDDWVCDEEDASSSAAAPSSASSSWTSSSQTSARPSSSQVSATTSTPPVQLAVSPSKPTTTTQAAWSSSQAARSSSTTTSASAAAQTSAASSSGGSWLTGGFATFFYQYGAYGACGKIHADSDPIVALAMARYGTGSNNAPDCGRKVEIKNDATGATVVATVADACPGCANYNSLDLSTGAFDAIADQAQGVVPISWKFIS
ncbi:hypothetical protein JCM10213_004962 [Rhodosporidiobolus nylandii]